jgi:hypothetical protein
LKVARVPEVLKFKLDKSGVIPAAALAVVQNRGLYFAAFYRSEDGRRPPQTCAPAADEHGESSSEVFEQRAVNVAPALKF